MSTLTLPEQVHQIADTLPPGATWDDVMYRVSVRQCIEAGLADAVANRVVESDEVRRKFGLEA